MKLAYYPGCSLEKSSGSYDLSVRLVCDKLGIALKEVDDWNCCGATEYFSLDQLTASAVIARNLARVDKELDTVVAPCAACYLNLKKTDHLMCRHAEMAHSIQECLAAGGLSYEPGSLKVRHLLDVIHDDIGREKLLQHVTDPLKGLRVAPYYGCQVVRPLEGPDCAEYPMAMDELFDWLGAEVVDYPVKAHCCGGHMTQISEEQSLELILRLLESARLYGADVILCMCPMCQLNLDAYQGRVNNHFGSDYRIPVLFFTQLMGLAFGLDPRDLGIGTEIISPESVLNILANGGA